VKRGEQRAVTFLLKYDDQCLFQLGKLFNQHTYKNSDFMETQRKVNDFLDAHRFAEGSENNVLMSQKANER